ncbi:MAG: GTPase ObgE [Phycisphaerae bacterium]|nr:GTPase ObgE [Phycisphaerae bacterium]
MLIDRAAIHVRSGKGGDGCVSLHRAKYVPKGGPDGGDGGDGGDVILVGDESLDTLLGFKRQQHFRARNGSQGLSRSRHGPNGDSLEVNVPLGCQVHDADTGELLVDIQQHQQRCVVASGGRGGYGNEHFKSSVNQTPREATPGEPWEERTLQLELKLIADVGLVGLPNAGKSTLLSALTRANAKVGDYPFTTISPQLGVAELDDDRRLVIADLPGLIRGAAGGAGLGLSFLSHIERTKVLVHVLDSSPQDGSDLIENYRSIRSELSSYSEDLACRPEVIALNKIDLLPADQVETLLREFADQLDADGTRPTIVPVSGATGTGTRQLLEAAWTLARLKAADGWSHQVDT